VLNAIAKTKSAFSPSLKWALQNSRWVMGTRGLLETAEALRAYKLQDVAQRITGDVLILAGEDDHFVPVEQVKQFESSLTQARSVTSVVYDRESGGAEHCQLGRRHPFGMPTSSIGCEGGMDWLSRRHQNCGKLRTVIIAAISVSAGHCSPRDF
jgi:hypothetical protein